MKLQPLPAKMSAPEKVYHIVDKKIVIPMIILIIIIITTIFVFSYLIKPEERVGASYAPIYEARERAPAEPEKPTYCDDLIAEGEYASEADCFTALAELNFNPAYCNGIENQQEKEACFSHIAFFLLDEEYCTAIGNKEGRGSEAECIFDIALEARDFTVCFSIRPDNGEFSSNHCIIEVAKLMNDVKACGFIAKGLPPYTVKDCLDATGGTPEDLIDEEVIIPEEFED
jgi:hypothetical protein